MGRETFKDVERRHSASWYREIIDGTWDQKLWICMMTSVTCPELLDEVNTEDVVFHVQQCLYSQNKCVNSFSSRL